MTNKKEVRMNVLRKIRLPAAEILRIQEAAKKVMNTLNFEGLKAQLGGSLAKGTMVNTGTGYDADIFVVFKRSENIVKLEEVLNKVKLEGTLVKRHGSRDYFQVKQEDIILELIPVVKTYDPELAENVTDVSLSHVTYVKNQLKENPELADDILLAKAFCRALGIYGAESYIKGFSGYALEVLVIHFKSFEKFLRGIGKKQIIDPQKYFKNAKEVLRELNESKTKGPLIVIDPTHQYRNVVAGLSQESYDTLLKGAKNYLKKPTEEAFEKKEFVEEEWKQEAKKKNARYVEIQLVTDRQEGDIAGTKCRKFFDFFMSELVRKQQKILKTHFHYPGYGKEATAHLLIKENKEYLIKGPNKGLAGPVEEFKKARKETFTKGDYWYAKEYTNIGNIFNETRKIENEMGAGGKITKLL